jgi:hypothetical protein
MDFVLAVNNFGDTRSGGLAGPMGLFIIVLMAISTVLLIRNMQALGVLSLLLCTACIFLLFIQRPQIAEYVFGASLLLMVGSLALSLWEIQISVNALNLQLRDLEDRPTKDEPR